MNNDLNMRIERMFNRDRLWAWAFVVALWLVLGFVSFSVSESVAEDNARMVIFGAAILLGILNTASIAAMINHYARDKHFIYDLDIRHLDEMRGMAAETHEKKNAKEYA